MEPKGQKLKLKFVYFVDGEKEVKKIRLDKEAVTWNGVCDLVLKAFGAFGIINPENIGLLHEDTNGTKTEILGAISLLNFLDTCAKTDATFSVLYEMAEGESPGVG